jgi:uncharacterized protein (TIGR02145 family)
MKKLIYSFLTLLIIGCSSNDEGNPCLYSPTLTTSAVANITEASATLNGVISIVSENCEVPNNTEQGFVYSTEIQPTLEDIQVNVNGTDISSTIEGLNPNTTYYVRSFLTNTFGDFYGNEISFSTEELPSLINCYGNPAPTIVYGTKEWSVENACNITYRDGTPIPQVTEYSVWKELKTGAWVYYENDPTKPRLYNWYAVMGIHDESSLSYPSQRKEFAPEGWHVASDTDWLTLEEHLIANGYNYDGTTTGNKIAKAMASTSGWESSTEVGNIGNDLSANNSSGFNAFPEGVRQLSVSNDYYGEGSYTGFWEYYDPYPSNSGAYRVLSTQQYLSEFLGRTAILKETGLSVRFVKD